MLRVIVAGVGVLAALGGLVLGGLALTGGGSGVDPGERFSATRQSAEATDRGIRVEVVGATFSGTETLLRMRATVVDREALRADVGDAEIRRILPGARAFAGDIEEGEALIGLSPGDELLVTLPPLVVPAGYSGQVQVAIREVTLHTEAQPLRLAGEWLLTLEGPTPGDLAQTLRVEDLGTSPIQIGGEPAIVRGVRSTSETRITMALPDGLMMITQPMLLTGGTRVGPSNSTGGEGEIVASFVATAFESEVILELGVIVAVSSDAPPPLTIDFGAAMSRSPKESTEFPVEEGDIVSGPAEIVLGGERGRHGQRNWVGVVVAGNWHPNDETPAIFDAEGRQLDRAQVQVGYRKTDDGTVTQGTTSIGAFVDKVSEVGLITFVFGGPTEIVSQGERVTLRPE